MRAIKIDCVKKEIYEIDIKGDNPSMYSALDSDWVDMVGLSRTEALWVDGEGLRRQPLLGAFRIDGYPQALPGHGLIIGLRGPENTSSKLTIEEVRKMVQLVDISELPLPVVTITSFEKAEDFMDYMKDPGKYKDQPSNN